MRPKWPPEGLLEASWRTLGAQGLSCGLFGALLGRSWLLLGASWGAPGGSWGPLGPLLGPPEQLLGLILASRGALFVAFGVSVFERPWTKHKNLDFC